MTNLVNVVNANNVDPQNVIGWQIQSDARPRSGRTSSEETMIDLVHGFEVVHFPQVNVDADYVAGREAVRVESRDQFLHR